MTYKRGSWADAGVAIIVGLLIGLFAAAVMPVQAQQPNDKYDGDCTGSETVGRCADKPLIFSHENCQYPDRWSNPVDGCDNSDPAVPECIKSFSTKAGEDACIAAFVAQHEQPNPAPVEVSECGGK